MNKKLQEIFEEFNIIITNSNLEEIVKKEFLKIDEIFTEYEDYYYGLAKIPIYTLKEDIIKEKINEEYLDKELSLIEKNLIYEYKKTLPETKIKEEKLKKERDEEYKKIKEYELNFMKKHYPEYLEGGYFKSDEFKQIYDKVSEYAKEQVAMDHGNGHKTYPMNPRRYFEIIRTVLKRDYNIDWKDRDTIWKEMHPDGYIIY